MSKPRDPVIAVITYFETAEPALAVQTLAIVSTIVKRRQPRPPSKPAPPKKKKSAAEQGQDDSLNRLALASN